MHDPAAILQRLDGAAFVQELFPGAPLADARGEVALRCPFHPDTTPSGSFNVVAKLYKCLACGVGTDAIGLLAQVTGKPRAAAAEWLARSLGVASEHAVAPDLVERYHAALRRDAATLDVLRAKKGLDVAAVERWRLGWDADARRLTIPVRDEAGTVVNLRRYDLLKVHDPRKKYLNLPGHGQLRLWPAEALAAPLDAAAPVTVWVTEGELKMIGLRQLGFHALTATGGAHGWKDEWDRRFAGRGVVFVYDVDATGQGRGRGLARRVLAAGAAWAKSLLLPLDLAAHPHGDVLDYLLTGYGAADLEHLAAMTPALEPAGAELAPALADDEEYEVALGVASKAQYHGRKVAVPVVASAKDTAPYVVPREVRVSCRRDQECCAGCPIASQPEDHVIEFGAAPLEAELLALIDLPADRLARHLRAAIGVPEECHAHELLTITAANLEEVRLVPQLATTRTSASNGEQTVTKAYYVGHGLETNAAYLMRGRATVDPRDQHATLVLTSAEADVDNLTTFEPTEAELAGLRFFQPAGGEWTAEAIDARLDARYADLAANVTRIYGRPAMHALMDLCWHSVLYVPLEGGDQKGWLDVLVLGDSGCGKTSAAMRLLDHYGLGTRVDMKGASVAGIKGGLQETQGRWFVQWGAAPLNDRGLLFLDEVKGAPVEALQALTDMRSSGVAELTKIERRRAHARTRLLWVSNARAARSVSTYNYGVLAIKELMGALEDVRRFDAALVVASGDVDPAALRAALEAGPVVPHDHDAERCRRLVLWAWSRMPSEVVVEPAAYAACLALAESQAARYSATIPLVEPADQRLKLARLAAATAALTYSCDATGRGLVVRPAHVEWAAAFLDALYAARHVGYAEYSAGARADETLRDPALARATVLESPYATELVEGLLRAGEIRPADLEDWAALERGAARALLGTLVRTNALRRGGDRYYKTPAFIELLRELRAALVATPDARLASRRDY